MTRTTTLAAALITVGLLAASTVSAAPAPTTSTAPAASSPFHFFNDGIFGCNITLMATNGSDRDVTVRLKDSKSKIRNGLWNNWDNDLANWTVNKGGSQESKVVGLSMSCNMGDRTYEFVMMSGGNDRIIKHPANGDFTGATTLQLGNIGRHF